MATRNLSLKLVISGEEKYRSAVAGINSQLKVMQSALKLTKSEFASQANSMEALRAKSEALTKVKDQLNKKLNEITAALANARKATEEYAKRKQELQTKIEQNAKALEELKKSTGDTTKEQAALEAEQKKLNAELEDNERRMAAAEKGCNNWETQLNNTKAQLGNLNVEIAKNDQYLEEAENSVDGCAQSIDEFGNEVEDNVDAVDALSAALGAAGLATALEKAKDLLVGCVEASVEFESAMAGVAKTTDMTDVELAAMGDEFQEMATRIPLTTTELAGIGEIAGQLGVAKGDIAAFTEVMAALGTATNLTSEEAATMLAQFAAVTGMDSSFYSNLGSTLVALGNNFATNEQKIADMSLAIAAAGNNANMSEADIFALSTAVTSLGIESANGGTQMSKLIMEMQTAVETGEDLDAWAAAAGMTASEFAALWGRDATAAITAFIGNLNNLDASASVTLSELGITETRMVRMITTLANAESQTGHLTSAINTANTAWSENTALTKEAETRYSTTESKLQLLSNSANNLSIAVGDKLTPAVGGVAEVGADLLNWAADMVENSTLLVPVVTAVGVGIGTLAVGLGVYTVATNLAAVATQLLGTTVTAFLATPVGLVITGIAAAASVLTLLATTISGDTDPTVKELTASAQAMGETFDAANAKYDDTVTKTEAAANVADRYISKLDELEATGLKTEAQQKEYHNTLELLCRTVPELAGYIDLETDSITGGTEALRANTAEWKRNALEQAAQEKLSEQYEAYADALLEAEENSVQLTRAQQELQAVQDEHQATLDRMAELYQEASDAADAYYEETGVLLDSAGFLSDEYWQLNDSLGSYTQKLFEAEDQVDTYQAALDESNSILAEHEDDINLATEAYDNFIASQTDAAASTNANDEAIISITSDLESLAQAYNDAYVEAYKSIDGQIGLFDEFSAEISKDTDTISEMMDRWAKQTENLGQYTENLQKAAQYGLDDGLIASLADGSAESAGYLATIIQGLEDAGASTEGMGEGAVAAVEEFNAAFAETEQAKESFANTVASIQTDFDSTIATLEEQAANVDFSGFNEAFETAFTDIGPQAQEIGLGFGTSLAEGITSGTESVTAAATEVVNSATTALTDSIGGGGGGGEGGGGGGEGGGGGGTYAAGLAFDTGLANGISENSNLVTETVTTFNTTLQEQLNTGADEMVNGFIEHFATIKDRTNAELTELQGIVTTATAPLKTQMQQVGVDMVDGLIAGAQSRAGALSSAIASIVEDAISSARGAADAHSPSRKTMSLGIDIDDGLIVGVKQKEKEVADSFQSVIKTSLKVDLNSSTNGVVRDLPQMRPEALDRAASTATNNTTTVNIYPQNLSKEQMDYIFRKFNVRFGGAIN